MKMKTKQLGVMLLSILLLILCLGTNSALADGESSEGTSATPFAGQVRAGVTPDYTIDFSQALSPVTGVYTLNGNVIELEGQDKIYEITGTTTTYGIKADKNCIILLNDATITSPAASSIDIQNHTVTMTLLDNTDNKVITTANNYAGISTTGGTLTINGSAQVNATGGIMGAGIGSGRCNNNTNAGTIKIIGGVVKATGGANVGGGGADLSGGAGLGTGGINNADSLNINAGTIEITGGIVIAQGGDNVPGIGLSDRATGSSSVGTGVITGGNVLSIDGTGALATQEMKLYEDSSHATRVYQNTLTVDQLNTVGTVSSFTTSDNIFYNIAGTNTISNGTAEVVSVWLPSNSSFETTMLEINGQK